MAKPSWLTVSPMSGSGNGVLQNTGAVHTGRNVRTGTVTVTATGVAQPKTYKVTQEAKPEFISIDNGADMAADKAGGKVTVTGKSNSAKLAFSWVGEAHSGTIASTYTAGGTSTGNGEAIDGDPGASAEYNWSVELTLPANETVEQVDRTLKVDNGNSLSQQIVIEQTGQRGECQRDFEHKLDDIVRYGTAYRMGNGRRQPARHLYGRRQRYRKAGERHRKPYGLPPFADGHVPHHQGSGRKDAPPYRQPAQPEGIRKRRHPVRHPCARRLGIRRHANDNRRGMQGVGQCIDNRINVRL